MTKDASTGPIPRDVFARLIDAPHGEALNTIRKYDPLFRRQNGELLKWKVTYFRTILDTGTAIIEAADEKQAWIIADKISTKEISWSMGDASPHAGCIESVEVMP